MVDEKKESEKQIHRLRDKLEVRKIRWTTRKIAMKRSTDRDKLEVRKASWRTGRKIATKRSVVSGIKWS